MEGVKAMENPRRRFLTLMGLAPFAVFAAGKARAVDAACYNPSALPLSI